MKNYTIKYSIYFIKNQSHQKGEIEIEDGVSFRDNEGRVIIIVDSEDAVNYLRNLYKEDIGCIPAEQKKIRTNVGEVYI